jgi:ribosome-binding protein aMBF1 (putative translation factor)
MSVVQVVIEYEQGKAIPNQQILTKMEKALGRYLVFCFVSFSVFLQKNRS